MVAEPILTARVGFRRSSTLASLYFVARVTTVDTGSVRIIARPASSRTGRIVDWTPTFRKPSLHGKQDKCLFHAGIEMPGAAPVAEQKLPPEARFSGDSLTIQH
jgi:hypothetical protein